MRALGASLEVNESASDEIRCYNLVP
jgi:hypothetical protein